MTIRTGDGVTATVHGVDISGYVVYIDEMRTCTVKLDEPTVIDGFRHRTVPEGQPLRTVYLPEAMLTPIPGRHHGERVIPTRKDSNHNTL